MIFDSLIIENFGAYAGAQQMTLSPLPGKPVVLVGGMNGGGKTTLLDAVQLVLGASYVGHLDDLAVFNRALTEAEVKVLNGLKTGARELHR